MGRLGHLDAIKASAKGDAAGMIDVTPAPEKVPKHRTNGHSVTTADTSDAES